MTGAGGRRIRPQNGALWTCLALGGCVGCTYGLCVYHSASDIVGGFPGRVRDYLLQLYTSGYAKRGLRPMEMEPGFLPPNAKLSKLLSHLS